MLLRCCCGVCSVELGKRVKDKEKIPVDRDGLLGVVVL